MFIEHTQALILASVWDDLEVYRKITSFLHTVGKLCARTISINTANDLGRVPNSSVMQSLRHFHALNVVTLFCMHEFYFIYKVNS